MSPFSITTDNLAKRYRRDWIIRDFSYTFNAGNTYAVTGPNGSGKSTLLQMLWGQMLPSSGRIGFQKEGQDVNPENLHRHVAIAAPYLELLEELTLEEHIRFHHSLRHTHEGMTTDSILAMMELSEERSKPIAAFSSGMMQRLKLGLAFSTDADVLFLDEPHTNLDQASQDWYHKRLSETDPRCLVIIASNGADQYPSNTFVINMLEHKKRR